MNFVEQETFVIVQLWIRLLIFNNLTWLCAGGYHVHDPVINWLSLVQVSKSGDLK